MRKPQLSVVFFILLSLTIIFTSGCGGTKKKKQFDTKPVSVKKFDTPPGADPSVSAEMGGNGFTGEGWITKADFNVVGNPKAVKGGSIVMPILDFPPTLRLVGKDANHYFNYLLKYSIAYEGLLNTDPITEEFIPELATHWKISDDKKEFTFRINPDARFADGKPVTSEDVVATWKLYTDPGILEAYTNLLYGSYEQPVALSKYIVSVKTKELNWRQFLYFAASMRIMPAHVIGNMSGKDYLEKFQFEFIPGSGPYTIDPNDVKKGQSIAIRRRSDYWGENLKQNAGKFNFDYIRFDVVPDKTIEFEKLKKGELDLVELTSITRVDNWFGLDKNEKFQQGLILKRDIFNEYPSGVRGICFNMRKAPFDDIRIRKAFAHLFDRQKFVEKLYYNLPALEDSYWANSPYENPNNPKIRYNQDEAAKLLTEAGWTQKNSDGYLVKDGKIFEVEIIFGSADLQRFLTVYQEDCKKAGIKLNLRQTDPTTSFKIGNERNFDLIVAAWGGLVYPNPESSFKSNTADEPNTTNWAGVKNERIDQLCDQYDITYDRAERIRIIQEIDGILASMQPYALSWYYPSQRIAYTNQFGHPEGYFSRTGDAFDDVPTYWYNDPEKAAEYDEAVKDPNKKLEQGEQVIKYWATKKAN